MFISALGAITGKENRLGLPRVKNACVILVDGLGSANIQFRAGHAPTIASQLTVDGSITCGFPSTTVSSLASFSTGVRPGIHGMVGYQVRDSGSGEQINLLTGISSAEQAQFWQGQTTVAEIAKAQDVTCHFVGPSEYDGSGFTMATMRGAKYVAAKTIEDRFKAAHKIMAACPNNLVYLYVPELDQKAHAHGFKSAQWVEKLEDLDAELKKFLKQLPANAGALLTADHGIVDVPVENQIHIDELGLQGIEWVGGDPRVLFLYLKDSESAKTRAALQDYLGKRAYVATKDELVAAGWFGEVLAPALKRLPDLFLIALGSTALYHREFAKPKSLQMIGQHGSVSAEELTIPLLKFGGFAKN